MSKTTRLLDASIGSSYDTLSVKRVGGNAARSVATSWFFDGSTTPPASSIAISASTPAYASFSGKPWTSPSFTPPNNSLLVVVINDDWLQFAPPTLTVTSTGLTFNQEVHAGGAVGASGGVAIYTCDVGSNGGTARTVSATTNTTSASGDSGGIKVYVVTGHDPVNPVDQTGAGSSTTNNITPVALTTDADGCWVFGGGTEWNVLGVPTSTDVAEGFDVANLSGMCVRKAAATSPAGPVTLNFDAAGTGAPIWNWAAISIRPAPASSVSLVVQSATQAHTVSAPAITKTSALVVAGATHSHVATTPGTVTIGWLADYPLQGGTTSLTMAPPAGTAADDLAIIWVANKNSSVTPTNPAGWTLLGQQVVGTGVDGVGTGQIMLTAWTQTLTGTATNTSVTITGANRSLGGGMVYRKSSVDKAWAPIISFGSDVTNDTAFSATMADNLGVLVGDYLLSVGVFTSSTSLTGRGITVPGVTSIRTAINSAGGATGNQIYMWTDHAVSTAGTQTAASTTTATSGGITNGGALNVRVSVAPGVDLVVQSAAHPHSVSAPVLAQVYNLTVQDATQTHTVSSPAIAKNSTLVVQGSTHAHVASALVLTQVYVLAVQGDRHTQVSGSPALTQVHNLAVAGSVHAHSTTGVVLTQVHQLTVQSAAHAQLVGQPTVTKNSVISVQAAGHAQLAGQPAITKNSDVSVQSVAHAQLAGQPTVTKNSSLLVQSVVHSHSATTVGLTKNSTLVAQGSTQTQLAGSPTPTQTHNLAVQGARHVQAVEHVATSGAGQIGPQDTRHVQTSANVTLSQVHQLTVQSAIQGHSSGHVTLTQRHVLVAQGAVHPQSAPGLQLTQVHRLTVQSTSHAQVAANVPLTQAYQLIVSATVQGQRVATVAITLAYLLEVQEATHGHLAGTVATTTEYDLAVQDSTHGHAASAAMLYLPSAMAFFWWDGTTRTPVRVRGMWNGTSVVPVRLNRFDG